MTASDSFDEDWNPVGEALGDEYYIRQALGLAAQAYEADEVPVGAIIVHQGRIIAAAHNQREMLRDPTAHAEMIAITQAAEAIGDWRLDQCTLYVTLEPCPMCCGALLQSRMKRLVFGALDPKAGAVQSLYTLGSDPRMNHQLLITSEVLAGDCGSILTQFFRQKRAQGKK